MKTIGKDAEVTNSPDASKGNVVADVMKSEKSRVTSLKKCIDESSSYFKAITRDKWQQLFNKGTSNTSTGPYNPKYTLLEPYIFYY